MHACMQGVSEEGLSDCGGASGVRRQVEQRLLFSAGGQTSQLCRLQKAGLTALTWSLARLGGGSDALWKGLAQRLKAAVDFFNPQVSG